MGVFNNLFKNNKIASTLPIPSKSIFVDQYRKLCLMLDMEFTIELQHILKIPVYRHEHLLFCAWFTDTLYVTVVRGIKKQEIDKTIYCDFIESVCDEISHVAKCNLKESHEILRESIYSYNQVWDKCVSINSYYPLYDEYVFILTKVEGINLHRDKTCELLKNEGHRIMNYFNDNT